MTWRRSFRPEPAGPEAQQGGFVRAMLIAAETPPTATVAPSSGQMVIIVGKDRRVIVDAGVDTAALYMVRRRDSPSQGWDPQNPIDRHPRSTDVAALPLAKWIC